MPVSEKRSASPERQVDDKRPKNVVFGRLGQTREHHTLFLLDQRSGFFRSMNFVSSLAPRIAGAFF
jgi:hypothetical protein